MCISIKIFLQFVLLLDFKSLIILFNMFKMPFLDMNREKIVKHDLWANVRYLMKPLLYVYYL